jgi:hypothetical protein
MLPSNGLPFSCRERAGKTFKNRTISREAVSCNGGLGRYAYAETLRVKGHA